MCTLCGPMRAAAFGASPGADAFAAATAADPCARWLAAVVLGGQGHYAAAATVLRELATRPRPLWSSLAASTLASHRRQLGAHAAARRLDAVALRRCAGHAVRAGSAAGAEHVVGAGADEAIDPDGVDVAGARADALTGLAADALGLGELTAARRLITAAGHVATPSWRTAVRLDWVRAEAALFAGRPHAAVGAARRAVRLADEAGAARHAAKSRLVLAASLHAGGQRDEADELLHGLASACPAHHLVPLRWPVEQLLGELHGPSEHGRRHADTACAALRFLFRRTDATVRTAAQSSRWVPSGGLRAGNSAERSSAGEILGEICTGLCQGWSPRDR